MNDLFVSTADNDVRYVPGLASAGEHSAVAHESRYQWLAQNFVLKNLTVLDFGCGSGYGANIMARLAGTVDAVDYSPAAIEYAKVHSSSPNLKFVSADACCRKTVDLLGRRKYDLIVSFDVIEHLERYFDYLENVAELMRDDGIVVIGCPNRLQCFEWNREWNPYHFQEFSPYQFRKILAHFFSTVTLFSQDFKEPGKREAARRQNRGGGSLWKDVARQVLPPLALRSLKSMKLFAKSIRMRQPNAQIFETGDIGFAQEPGEDVLRSAFGMVAVCSKGNPRISPNQSFA